MAKAAQLDSLDFESLEFPYDRIANELSEKPRLIRGQNVYIHHGKLLKRPGTLEVSGGASTTRPKRLIIYETLDTPPKIYLLRSTETATNVWRVEYCDLDAGTGWVSVGSLRQVDASTRPHEMEVHKGKVYIKGFPTAASGEKLGSVIFDGSSGVPKLHPWGMLGPTEPAHVVDPGTWSNTVTAHGFIIRQGWKYVYCYEDITGHISNHSPLETNPDKDPSDTGPTTQSAGVGHCPEISLGGGQTDTTNFPFIDIFRSTDGGGTFYFLDQVANTGAAQTYVDKQRESGASGGVFEDPISDDMLDITDIAPLDQQNNPPPPVAAPKVIGTDTPEPCTRIISWNGRLWYGIGHDLFSSSVEEIINGVGEACFVGGIRGNIFRCDSPIMNLSKTKDELLIHTLTSTEHITGTLRETFEKNPLVPDVGAPYGHNRASCQLGDQAVWLTHDFRIAMAGPRGYAILSDVLFTDIIDEVIRGSEIQLLHWAELDKDWLIVLAHRADNPTESRQWVLDTGKLLPSSPGERTEIFWSPPWAVPCVVACQGRIHQETSNRRLIFGIWNSDEDAFALVRMDATDRTGTEFMPGTGADTGNIGFTWAATFHQHLIPPGNHVNTVSRMHLTPVVHELHYDRLSFPGDTDPSIYWFRDDLWTDPIAALEILTPERRKPSKAYQSNFININEVCQRFSWQIQKINDTQLFELPRYHVVYNPGGGA